MWLQSRCPLQKTPFLVTPPFWYNDDDVQGMLPPKERKLSKVENPKAEMNRVLINELMAKSLLSLQG